MPQGPSKTGVNKTGVSKTGPSKSGPNLILAYVKTLPAKPGVYRMIDEAGQILYVGKAKNLKKRVTAYTKFDRHPVRIKRMIAATRAMEFVITGSETEALLLEARLIKKLKPPYNILLRDGKSFPYILMRTNHEAAQLMKHRGRRNKQGHYFGPFASAGAVNRTLDTLQRAFYLRTCSDSVYAARSRPCMLYQIKRCAAPCTGEISLQDYAALNQDAIDFLSGRSEALRKRLQAQMKAAAAHLDYEKAAEIRDRLKALAFISTAQTGLSPKTFLEADIAAIAMQGGRACIQVFFFRAGQNWGANAYFPRHAKDQNEGDILDAFLAQFYLGKPIPKRLFVNIDLPHKPLLEQALAERRGKAFHIFRPRRGEKYTLVQLAEKNAHEALARKMAETASQQNLLAQVKEAFDLPAIPERIEVYDNSHIQGTHAIGAFIVAGPEGFQKRDYRTFNIKDMHMQAGDDYAMMREVMRRRFSRLLKEDNAVWPDLVLIDGGKGQLCAVKSVLEDLGVLERTTLLAISKGPDRNAGREHFHMQGRSEFTLPASTPLLYYLQRLRDEAHRFAIGTHRARRKKQMHTNPLDAIDGIGPGRKKALLAWFGSAKGVADAGIDDLIKVDGISKRLAGIIYDHFNE